MTELNPLSAAEVTAKNSDTRRKFWGTIALDAILMLLSIYFLIIVMQQAEALTTTHIIAMALFIFTTAATVISLVLTARHQQESGMKLTLFTLFSIGITVISLFVGRAITASLSILVVSAIAVRWLLPSQSRRRYSVFAAMAVILMWIIEWINPSWRVQIDAAKLGPFAVVTFVVILGTVVTRPAWIKNNIRSRFLTFSLGLTLIASVVIALVSVNSLLSAGQQAQETSSQVLRSQAQESLVNQTVEIAIQNELVLQGTSQDASDVAYQVAYILENPNAFNAQPFWKIDEHMFFGPEGQYINGEEDVSAVFVPNTVELSEDFKQKLERLAFLDMVFVPVYEGDSNTVAIYYVDKDEVSWLHPNINLGTLVPPDYLATEDIFYTSGAPENNPERQVVWTSVYDDPGGQGLLVSAIAPVYTARNVFRGVVGIDISLAGLTDTIEQEDLSSGGYSFLIDTAGRALALPEQGYRDFLGREREPGEFGSDFISSARPEVSQILSDMLGGKTGFQSVFIDDQELFVAYTTLESTGWHIASVVSAEQVLAPATALQTKLQEQSRSLVIQRILPIGVVIVVLVLVMSIFFINRLVNPIERLTEGAAKIGSGEWDTPLPQSEMSEINGLSRTLRDMAAQLKSTLGSLEQRVADRTRNLELAAEVGRSVSQVRDLDVMLRDACELIQKEFDLYYVQTYLADPGQRKLVLEAGTGGVGAQLLGRGHSLPLNTGSINGRAAIEKRTVVIPNTAESTTFRPNPLLPETRGEMAVPLVVGDKVVGVLDMQSRHPGTLNEEVLPAFEALAGQLAVAVQNANLLAEAQQARAEVEAQARRLVRKGWDEYLDAIHKPEQIGFMFDHSKVVPLNETDSSQVPADEFTVSAPIAVTGEALGSLVVEIDDESKSEQTAELVSLVARQVAQQIENLRLLESAERYRYEAEQVARRQTREGWQEYINTRATDSLGYLFDLKEVRPYSNGKEDASALNLQLKVRDEAIGKLSVQGLAPDDKESVELANAVAERLGAHIESLRQHDRTQSALAQSEKLFDASRRLTQATDLQELVGATVNTLAIPAVNRALMVTFDYNSVGEVEQLSVIANWWNGSGHETTPVGTRYPLEVIRVMPMFVSPTPVFFNDAFHDDRVDATTMELVKKLNLRAVAVLPLHTASHQLGALILEAEEPHNFSPDETRLFTSLAPQITTVVENRQQYERAQHQAEREAMLNTINQKIQSATSVEAVLQIAARELGHALGAPMTIAQLSIKGQD